MITDFELIENAVGTIVGLEVDGVLQLTGGVLGTDVITEDFTTTAQVTSSGPGPSRDFRCVACALRCHLSR